MGSVAAVVDEELVAGAMLLAHRDVELLMPEGIALTEVAVLIAVGLPLLVLLPQEHEGQVLLGHQFVVQRLPVRLGEVADYRMEDGRVEKPFQCFVVDGG